MVVVSLVFLIGSICGWFGIYSTIAVIFVFLACVGITYPNSMALSLAPFSKNAGTAASLMGALQMTVGTIVSIIVSQFKSRTSIPMAGLMFIAAVLAFVILVVGRGRIKDVGEEKVDVLIH